MGRLIDADKLKDSIVIPDPNGMTSSDMYMLNQLKKWIDCRPTVEAIPKDQYETRLKADLEAILVEIQLEIEELDSRAGYDGGGMPTFSTDYIRKKKVNELVQQKINTIRGDKNDV